MRTVRIVRPGRMEAGAMALKAELDGAPVGKLKNKGELRLEMDEGAHEIALHGGFLAGKGFSNNLRVPAGAYSYSFQVDMIAQGKSTNYKPVLRPCGEERLKDDTRTRSLIGVTCCQMLLDQRVRDLLDSAADAVAEVRLSQNGWSLTAIIAGERLPLFDQDYSHAEGGLLAMVTNLAEGAAVDTAEHRAATLEHLFGQYFAFLPDYERAGENCLRFLG